MFRAHEITSYDGPFNFGIDQKKAAAQLRKLAEEIETAHDPKFDTDREYRALSQVEIVDSVDMNDYSLTTVVLKFATIKPNERKDRGEIAGPTPIEEAPEHIREHVDNPNKTIDTPEPAV